MFPSLKFTLSLSVLLLLLILPNITSAAKIPIIVDHRAKIITLNNNDVATQQAIQCLKSNNVPFDTIIFDSYDSYKSDSDLLLRPLCEESKFPEILLLNNDYNTIVTKSICGYNLTTLNSLIKGKIIFTDLKNCPESNTIENTPTDNNIYKTEVKSGSDNTFKAIICGYDNTTYNQITEAIQCANTKTESYTSGQGAATITVSTSEIVPEFSLASQNYQDLVNKLKKTGFAVITKYGGREECVATPKLTNCTTATNDEPAPAPTPNPNTDGTPGGPGSTTDDYNYGIDLGMLGSSLSFNPDGDLQQMVQPFLLRVIYFIFALIGFFTVIGIIYAGYLMITAAGNEEQIKKGRSALTNSVLGLILTFTAYLIIFAIQQWMSGTQ